MRNHKSIKGDNAFVESDCPEAIKTFFLQGTHYTYKMTQLKIGSAKPLSSRIGGDINDSVEPPFSVGRICTATATVEADGCTWTLDAISNPAPKLVVNAWAIHSFTRSAGRGCQLVARNQR